MKNILLVFLILLPMTIHAHDFNRPTMKSFTARVSSVRLSADLLEKGKKMDDLVSAKASSIILSQPLNISDVRKAKPYNQPAIDTFIGYIKACIDRSVVELSKFWVKTERNEQLALLSDPEFLKQTHQQFKEDPSITIIGLIFKEEQTTILMRGPLPDSVVGVSLVNVDGGIFLTNKPKDDLDLAIIEASFNEVTPTKRGRRTAR